MCFCLETSTSRKRALDFTNVNSDGGENKLKSSENEMWNSVHVSLVHDLEKKGILGRYGVKHLKVWTDEIINGKSAGVGEEPIWHNFIDQVGVPPKSPRDSITADVQPRNSATSTDDLIKAMIIQGQQRIEIENKRAEMFQTSVMAMIAASSQSLQQQVLYVEYNYIVQVDTPHKSVRLLNKRFFKCLNLKDANKLTQKLFLHSVHLDNSSLPL